MQKIALSIAVIAVSGGYVLLEAGQPSSDFAAMSATADPALEPALAPPAEVSQIAPAKVLPLPPATEPAPQPPVSNPVPAAILVPSQPYGSDDEDGTGQLIVEATPLLQPALPRPRPEVVQISTPPKVKVAPTPATRPATLTKAAASTKLVAASNALYADGAYTGSVANAYYGYVQVRAIVTGGRLAAVNVLQYPSDRRTSIRINSYALPRLESQAIQNQSGRVNGITGATLTSMAYRQSLTAALAQAAL